MTETAGDPLRLVVCPACGYSLRGLAGEGVCPECGRVYDQRTVVLHGWARGSRVSIVTARPWVAAGILCLNSIWVVNLLFTQRTLSLVEDALLLTWLLLFGWLLWRRYEGRDLPGLIQVHLSEAGARRRRRRSCRRSGRRRGRGSTQS